MRRCYACQQMKAVVLVAKKPDGKHGYICSECHEDSARDWYYWTNNQYTHFIVFRISENRVATGIIKPVVGKLEWKVNGPCWSTYEETGTVDSLDEAKEAVDKRVMKIIEQEFRPEYVHPLG